MPKRGTSSGSCSVDHFSPPISELGPSTQKLNVYLSFAEASRLVMALQDRLQQIHKLDRRGRDAKEAAVNLVIALDVNNVAVMPGKLIQSKN